MTIMVTGGSGFIGAHATRLLAEHAGIVIYDMAPLDHERKWLIKPVKDKVKFVQGQMLDWPALLLAIKKYDVKKVVHAAAFIPRLQTAQHPMMALKINVEGTLNVLEAARIMDLERVVFISTVDVFASIQYEPADENHPVLLSYETATAPYGTSKFSSEAFGLNYFTHHGVDFVALRLTANFGLGMRRWMREVAEMIENSLKGVSTRLPLGREIKRDYIYVKDTACAIRRALDVEKNKLKDRIFIIATGRKPITLGEFAKILMEVIPSADIEIGPGLNDINKIMVKHKGQYNIERARRILRWEPKYDLKNGIRDYVKMYNQWRAQSK